MLTAISFVVALGLLIAVHEYGHYRVAVACGVKVLRFSVGFGKTLYRWQPRNQKHGQSTEFVIGAFPLGGYVKMLDEREGPVAPQERHLAFNTQPLKSRAAIVAAGPIANLLLAVALYAVVNWTGVDEPKAVLASPMAGSLAEQAGLRSGDLVEKAGLDEADLQPVRSFEDVRWVLTRGALDREAVHLVVSSGGAQRQVALPLDRLDAHVIDAELFRKVGILLPWTRARAGEVVPGGAAQKGGLLPDDLILKIDDVAITEGQQVYELIRRSAAGGTAKEQLWEVERGGKVMQLHITPAMVSEGGQTFGRIGAVVQQPPDLVRVRYGVGEGLWKGVERTWEMSAITLRLMGRMIIGQASLKNLSGPITIAEYAGKSASIGLTQYLLFLAVISVSLGVLNLLPVPVLDGGHLMYYLWEAVTGKGVSDAWMERLQRGGVAVLLVMMTIALFNDVSRHVIRLFG